MARKREERRLVAILAADMVGYSRLMEADERGTIARQKAHRNELIDPKITEHNGRIVKTTGDGLLVEFASVVDATECAVAIQRAMAEREADVPEDRRIRYRVGINLGDIIVEDDDIYGDGVNVAARLEGLAEPGGVCISGTAYDHLKQTVEAGYEYLGEQQVKNIETPVRVYKVLLELDAAGQVIGEKWISRGRKHLRAMVAVAVAVIAVAVAAIWWQPWVERVERASIERMAFPLPDKPSIAVLPFDNLSGDPNQDYLGDGLTENIISSLSKVSEMLVIARNSTSTYKGKPVKVQQVAEELGVRYVLEGSVQKSGDRLRVTAQLIDAVEGHHLWSERYDRRTEDLFALQDDITQKIVVAMQVILTEGEQARVRQRSTNNLQAWGYYVKGLDSFRRLGKEDNARARELLSQAVVLDPQYAAAWVVLAWTHLQDARFGWSKSRAKSFQKGVELAKKALELGSNEPDTYVLMGYSFLLRREYDLAVAEGRKALELGPNMADINAIVGITMRFVGNWDETIRLGKRAVRRNPKALSWYLITPGHAQVFKREYNAAIATFEEGLRRAESDRLRSVFHIGLAFAHSEAGRLEIARKHMVAALKLGPYFSARYLRGGTFYKDPAHTKRYISALSKAGLPE